VDLSKPDDETELSGSSTPGWQILLSSLSRPCKSSRKHELGHDTEGSHDEIDKKVCESDDTDDFYNVEESYQAVRKLLSYSTN